MKIRNDVVKGKVKKMSKLLSLLPKVNLACSRNSYLHNRLCVRSFLSKTYQCKDVWENRLNSPILQKVNLDELYHSLDQRFQKTRQISAVDVDVFANAVQDDLFIDEMLDLVHKLRLTSETANALDSMTHAVIRMLIEYKKYDELLNVLDDRLNYGLFLDYYTANLLLDIFWKNKDYAAGSRIASQFMLQEECDDPLTNSLCLLHCYNFLLKPEKWNISPPPNEPEEEVKVRVKYLRNPYNDDHFDLKDPNKIVGKTLVFLTKGKNDALNKSFSILGYMLFEKENKAQEVLKTCESGNIPVYKEIFDIGTKDNDISKGISVLKRESADVQNLLITEVQNAVKERADKDIANQQKIFEEWEKNRLQALQNEKNRLHKIKRLEEIDNLQKDLKDRETKLWFFENEEKIELAIDAKVRYYPKKWFGKKKKPRKIDENYVPPEISSKVVTK